MINQQKFTSFTCVVYMKVVFTLGITFFTYKKKKLDRVGPVDNRPSFV